MDHSRAGSDSPFGSSTWFRLDTEIQRPLDGISNVAANLTMMGTSHLATGKSLVFPFHGITFSNQSFFVLVGTFSKEESIDIEWSREFFVNKTLNIRGKKYHFNHKRQIAEFLRKYPDKRIVLRIVTISFKVRKSDKNASAFSLPFDTKGTYFEGRAVKIGISGSEFDHRKYSKEVRIFGTVMGFCITLSMLAWRSLNQFMHFQHHLNSVSFTTILMTLAYDLSSCFIIVCVSDVNHRPSPLFVFLFFSQLLIHMVIQFPTLFGLFRHQDILHSGIVGLGSNTVLFLLTVFTTVYSRSSYESTAVVISNSQWIPQILQNVIHFQKFGISLRFVTWTTIQRILVIWYFMSYESNIFEVLKRKTWRIVTPWLCAQWMILVLQRIIGPRFFLPKLFKRKPFDYKAKVPDASEICTVCYSPIEEATDYAVTPCKHAFHMTCLKRCMEEKYECPLCRNPLPEIA